MEQRDIMRGMAAGMAGMVGGQALGGVGAAGAAAWACSVGWASCTCPENLTNLGALPSTGAGVLVGGPRHAAGSGSTATIFGVLPPGR